MSTNLPLQGISLVELLIALVLLEIAAVAALHSAIQLKRTSRALSARAATDHARMAAIRNAAADSSCRQFPVSSFRTVTLPAAEGRGELTVLVRCGP